MNRRRPQQAVRARTLKALPQVTHLETPPSTASPGDDQRPHPLVPLGTKRYVLLCVNSGGHRINLAHVDVTHNGHDEVLFQQIRAAYAELRGNQARILIVARTMQYKEVFSASNGLLK